MMEGQTIVHNPIIWADVPDVDVIRVEDTFYMVSTSMHSMPGCPIMKSKDLAHWELAHYVFDTFEDTPGHTLEDGKGIYGKGSWAACIRQHEQYCYVIFNCNDTGHFYVYRTADIASGTWEQWAKIPGFFHDPTLLWEEDDTPYVIYGGGDIRIRQLKKDLSGVEENGVDKPLLSTPKEGIGLRCEGGHAYKINGKYYLLYIEWPIEGNKRRREVCYRSDTLFGPYERKIILDDDMGYFNQGVAQGCIFDTKQGDWYALLFQDHHAVGRIPHLLPVTWEEGWPMLGIDGKVPKSFTVNLPECPGKPLLGNDSFGERDKGLPLFWQWNHNPDPDNWSLLKRPGCLRLTTGKVVEKGLLQARNTLTQRTFGPSCEAVCKLDLEGLSPGDCAGIAAVQDKFGLIGVRRKNYQDTTVVMCVNDGVGGEKVVEEIPFACQEIYLKIHFNFKNSIDMAYFFYSSDGMEWKQLGGGHHLEYTLVHFMGCRVGLYCYATKETGGYADFDSFWFTPFAERAEDRQEHGGESSER